MRANLLQLLLLALLLPSLLLNILLLSRKAETDSTGLVKTVIDGDTLELKSGQSLRLSGLNAPELPFCGGPEAKVALASLVLNKKIRFQVLTKDKFGRSLAAIYLDGRLVNESLIAEGWARYEAVHDPQADRLKAAQKEAQEKKRGIFGPLCLSEKPEKEDCTLKGNVDQKTGEKSYYPINCPVYRKVVVQKDLGEAWFCTEEAAREAGFQRAPYCPTKP